MLTRRHILTSAAASLALPFAPRTLWAASTLTMGQMQIDTLSDGHLVLPGDFILGGMPQAEMAQIITSYGLPTDQLTPPCNVTLMRDGTNTVLFDVGAGPDFQPSAGKLTQALDAAGLSPEDITHVVFTHAHPDHLWGLLDDFDEPVFANAEYLMGQAEFDYWTDPDTVSTIGEARTTFAIGAQRRLMAIAETLRFVSDGEEILPGIAARLTPGHTPGHMAYELRAGSDAAMVVGDALGNHHVAFERPDWASGSDQDKDLAAQTRLALLDQITAAQMRLVGFHLPGGGIGRAEKSGSGYRFVAE
ncbi:MAG: MBL fold metallo-hydrolase [Pseudotabrizicola sp.]|uniref:MBL fold metallo-hydrolase n=1 Tax=Pseudotabrizicola sp. TaxID=2939647 RepID=UPI002717802B|nr:MBL fold metallo-hydrolase [Pseudotabrizicola sp.]MDO9638037.1 MBL fold metallo-hydrolase [Pseudotabrizicola sp.]